MPGPFGHFAEGAGGAKDRPSEKRCRVTQEPATSAPISLQVRGRLPSGQARLHRLLPILLLSACAVPDQINPRLIARDISGSAPETRLPPPGLDRPFPNLASVPPIPERPDPAARLALTTQLQAQRDLLNQPLSDQRPASPLLGGGAPGQPPVPAGPPGPPILARAPEIPWTTSATPVVTREAAPSATLAPSANPTPAAAPPSPDSIVPGDIPALPSADLLAPAPPLPPLR